MQLCKRERSQYTLGLTLAFGTLLVTGTYNSLAKGLMPFLSPMSLLVLSEALTGVFVIATFGLVPLLREFMKLDGKSLRMCIVIGLLNSAVAPLLWFTGLARTSAVNASILSSVDIIFILIFGYFLMREKIERMRLIGAGVVVSGIFVISLASFGEPISMHIGDLFILAGAMVFALGAVLFKKYLSHVMPELEILIRNVVGVTTVIVVSVLMGYTFVEEVVAFPARKILLLLAFAFFARYLNLTFFYEALERLPVTTFSLIMIASPLSGLLSAVIILGESVQPYQMLGAVVIVFGLLLEQCSLQALESLHHRWSFLHFPFRKPVQATQTVRILSKAGMGIAR